MFSLKFCNIKNLMYAKMHIILMQILRNKPQIATRIENETTEKKSQNTDFTEIIKSRVTNNSNETITDSLEGLV